MSTPAGWFPQDDGRQRYWDGEQWTENFAPGAAPVTPPAAARKNWFLRHKVLTAIGAVLLIGTFASIADGSDKTITTASVAAPIAVSTTPDQAALDQAAADQATADKAAADKAVIDKAAADKAAAELAVLDKAAADKAAADKKINDANRIARQVAAKKAAAKKAAAARVAAAKKAQAARVAAANRLTVSQENAKESAESYLDNSGFSRKGLIDQLKYEGYSVGDASRAIGRIKVNWNTEADQSAASYMENSSFSRSGLIDQLKYEGFTSSQAAHGASSVGL